MSCDVMSPRNALSSFTQHNNKINTTKQKDQHNNLTSTKAKDLPSFIILLSMLPFLKVLVAK